MDVQQRPLVPAIAVSRDKFGVSQRRRYRYEVHSLSYINIDDDNGGIIRNLNEAGLCVQSVAALRKNQQVQLRFELPTPRVRVGATARVCWVNATGLAGLEFSTLPPRSAQLIKDWLLTQLLLRGQRLFVSQSVFAGSVAAGASGAAQPLPRNFVPAVETPAGDAGGLLASLEEDESNESRAAFWAFMVDAAAILTSVLLFCVIVTGMLKTLPDWFVCAAVTILTAAILTGVYWILFASWIGTTPGNYLARKVFGNPKADFAEERSRFR